MRLLLFMPLLLLPVLTGCGEYDFSAHISDERSDLFLAETEEYRLSIACVSRERPFLADGIAAARSMTVEATLTENAPSGAEYELYFLEDVPRGGEMSFRNVTDDYYYSRGTDRFPSGSVSVRVVKNGAAQDLLATSVKSEETLTVKNALSAAIEAERETVDGLMKGGTFCGEFHVRLLRRDKNYYYVAILDGKGGSVAVLLDGETGKPLARKKS